uniref:mechanosensitive ion channel family protein n=1 Tax=Mucilaginibacter sp. Bleaf8 TaxID=2834430 RepID=UPI0020C021D2|nr:mechanosensitive ion channel domain-containing protein [Mucilaginibacter sp. Bleaf8]
MQFYTPATAQTTLNLKSDSGQAIPDTLLFKLQKAQATITQVNTANKKGYGLDQMRVELAQINKDVAPIKADLRITGKVIDSKTLFSYNLILKNSQDKLSEWQKNLTKSSNDLQGMSKEVVDLSKDTLLSVETKDSTARQLYFKQIKDIKLRLQDAGKVTSANLDSVSRLLASVSAVNLDISDLQASINAKLVSSGRSAFSRESPYIWSVPKNQDKENIATQLSASYSGQNKILGYFIDSTWDNRVLLILFGSVFFLWVYLNYRKAQKPEVKQNIGELDFKYISSIPVLPTLIVLLNLAPLFEPDAPALYIEIIEFLLLMVLTVFFWKQLTPKELRYWLFIVVLYIVVVLSTAAVHNAVWMRLWLMALNIGSLYVGIKFYKKLLNINVAKKLLKPVLIIYQAFNALAVIFNIFGRISLAKIYSVTAIMGFTQVIALAVFIQLFTDALELQIKVSSANGGWFSRLNLSKARISFKKALSVVAVILWLLVFFINLSIAGGIFAFVQHVLVKQRTLGSVNFTLSNVLFFAVILYISNVLQKHVSILLGEQSVGFTNEIEHKSSKLTLIRLVIALAGVLLAVTVSGIPLDKLTVVLGALSVGIGLGMQNIVNNFVSGIILIFEKPFQIGDFIELADKKGKIQDIGIRSSKMFTQQGTEVIIPNGDLLSNRLVNWTTNAAYVKSELLFKVHMSTDIAAVTKLIQQEIDSLPNAVKNIQPEVLINSIAADAIELKILVWISSVYAEPASKSQLLSQLITRFSEKEIKLM